MGCWGLVIYAATGAICSGKRCWIGYVVTPENALQSEIGARRSRRQRDPNFCLKGRSPKDGHGGLTAGSGYFPLCHPVRWHLISRLSQPYRELYSQIAGRLGPAILRGWQVLSWDSVAGSPHLPTI
jgi:hypothetical protein